MEPEMAGRCILYRELFTNFTRLEFTTVLQMSFRDTPRSPSSVQIHQKLALVIPTEASFNDQLLTLIDSEGRNLSFPCGRPSTSSLTPAKDSSF